MRIAYACYWDARRRDGVSEKIAGQVGAWRSAGHDVGVYLLSPPPRPGETLSLEAETFVFEHARGRWQATAHLYRAVRRSAPDLVYLRYDLFVPPPWGLARTAAAVVEVNSNWRAELAARSRPAALYERLQEPPLLRRAAGAVCVSGELARTVARRAPRLAVEVVANGIDLRALPPRPAEPHDGIRAVFVGDDVYWQGLDKVSLLAEALPEWHFDLIGVAPSAQTPRNVTCHGFLTRERYDPILARADLALGTLALHRKQMAEASPLKVGLYLAYGLPVVIAYDDTNLAGLDAWWLLRLPNGESNVAEGIAAIETFGRAVAGRRVARAEVADRISTEAKERARLAFFERVTGFA